MPIRGGFFHHIAQSPNSNNQNRAPRLGQWSPLLGLATGIGFGIRSPVVLLLVAHGPCIWNWSENEQTRDRSIGSEYPFFYLSNGTGTGEAIGLIGRISQTGTGMWSSRSYLRKDSPYTFIDQRLDQTIEAMRSIELSVLLYQIKQGLFRLLQAALGKRQTKRRMRNGLKRKPSLCMWKVYT